MIKKAKVNTLAVKAFKQAVSEVKEYSSKFEVGFAIIDEMIHWLMDIKTDLKENVSSMREACEHLKPTIKGIEEIIANLTARANTLEEEISNLKSELNGMEATFSVTNDEGVSSEVPNPAYLAKESEISSVEEELNCVEEELTEQQYRLDRANSARANLEAYIEEVNGIYYAVDEKMNICKRLRSELADAKSINSKKTTSAIESLKNVEKAIDEYLHARIEYEHVLNGVVADTVSAGRGGVNINININTNHDNAWYKDVPTEKREYSDKEIEHHNIKFDETERVSEFDGKTFGGKYRTYDNRFTEIKKMKAIYGVFEGVPGESRFVPSTNIAEGIVVQDILEQYGLTGIEYRNAEPDFEPCSVSVVTIKGMTENRYDYIDADGLQSLGNFSQADIECAKIWRMEEKDGKNDWTPRDVFNYRAAHRLTWHEKCDTKTMVLVRFEINQYFKHAGGCSECKARDSVNDDGGFDEE